MRPALGEDPKTPNLLTQLLLDPKLVVCTCQVRNVNPVDCVMHGHMFETRTPKPVRDERP